MKDDVFGCVAVAAKGAESEQAPALVYEAQACGEVSGDVFCSGA